MAVKKAVAKKTAVKVVPATAVLVGRKAPGATKSVPRKPTKAKARVDAVEKKLDATFRKVAAEIEADDPYSTDAEIDALLKKADKIVAKKTAPMGVSNVRRADNAGEVLTTIDAANVVDEKLENMAFGGDEFGFGFLSFEESDELDKIEEENREALKSRPIQSGPSKTRQHAEMETLRRDIAALQVELTQTKADLADSLKKIEELTKPKENWFISMFRTEERAG